MSKTIKILILSLSTALGIFIVAGGLGVRAASNSDGAYRQLGVYSEVLQRIKNEYVEEPNITAVTDGALHGLLESLDSNSSYLTPAEYKDYQARKNQPQGDIGAVVSKRFGYAAIVSVIPGSPADHAGMEPGVILESVEGKSTREMPLEEIRNMLAGQPGSTVNLELVSPRAVTPEKTAIQRAVVSAPPTLERTYEANSIGYINPETLTKGKSEEIAARIKTLQHEGAKKLILDLRNVASGDLNEGIAVANLFLDHGTISYLEGQKFPRQNFAADPKKSVTSLPMVVLVNRSTANAAELVASAILDNNRGDVVGEKSFGDGSVQKVIEVGDGSAVILSVAKYYSPSGKAFQDGGVTPNVLVASDDQDAFVPDDDDQTAAPKDASRGKTPKADEPLNRALQILKQRQG